MLRKTISIIFFTALLSNFVNGQDFKYLETEAENAETWEDQFDLYIKLVDTLSWRSYDHVRAEKYAQKAVTISQKQKDKTRELLAYSYLAEIQDFFGEYEFMETIIFPKLKEGNFSDKFVEARFNEMAGWYYYYIDYKKCIDYLLKAKEIYQQYYPKHKRITFINLQLPVLYFVTTGELFKHIYLLEEAIPRAEMQKDTPTLINIYNAFYVLSRIEGNTQEEMEYLLKVDELFDQIKTDAIYFHKSQLASAFQVKKELKKAEKIQKKLLQSLYKSNIKESYRARILGHVHSFMIERLYLQNQIDQAFQHLDSARHYSRIVKNDQERRVNYFEVLLLIKRKEYQRAEALLEGCLKNKTMVDEQFIDCFKELYQNSSIRPNPATMKRLDQLLDYHSKQFKGIYNEFSKTVNELQLILSIIKHDEKTSIDLMKSLAIKRDSIEALNSSEAVKALYVEYETKEKEQQLKVQTLELAQKSGQQNQLIGGILALFLIGGVSTLYFSNRNQLLQKDLASKKIIESQAKELQVLYDNKNRFFANIAHELRTPLTLIAGPVETVSKLKNLPIAAQKNLNIVNRNITYLKQLVNQILDLSKKEVKELNLQVNTFNFSDMLNALVADFQSFSDYQNIDFQIPNNINKSIKLTTDAEKLFIVLKNLLSNAFKYTHSEGQVRLNYVDMGQTLQVSVQDTGRGITETDIQYIFNPYFQTSDANAPIEGGTGIGLAISREYIESLGGTIQVNSEFGKGSTFVIQFPKQLEGIIATPIDLSFLETTKRTAVSLEAPLVSALSKEVLTILVVEDNVDICQHLQTILQENYQVIFANNGIQGLTQLEKYQPDLMITDLMMPVMDGFELIEKVKAQEKWRQIPIITLTARSEMTDKLHALRIGVDDYLIKPFLEEELKIRIENLLTNSKKRQAFLEAELEKTEALSIATNTTHVLTDNEPQMKATPKISVEDAEWLKSLETIVRNQITNVNFNINQLCLEMAVSSSQLYQKLKKLTGLTPKQYIDQIRYTKARKLLEMQTYNSVKRIAYEVGFKDEKNFSRNFKKRFGKYPSSYLN